MGYSKVVVNGITKLDLTQDTVSAGVMVQGYTAHDKALDKDITVKPIEVITVSNQGGGNTLII